MDVNARPKVMRGVRWNKEDDKGFIFNPFTGKYFQINLSAVVLMELADGKTSIQEIAEKILTEHETDFNTESLTARIISFYEDMVNEGVVEILPSESEG
jgi:hypothetical protein